METCSICGFTAKNKNGLRLHSKKHKQTIGEEEKAYSEENLPLARIELYDKETEELVLSYSVSRGKELDEAKENAKRKGYRIEIS